MPGHRTLIARVLGLAAAGLTLGACQSGPTAAELDAAYAESAELRSRLEAAAVEVDAASAAVEDLENENEQLRTRLAEAESQAAEQQPGIAGVEIASRGSDVVMRVAGDVLFDSGSIELRPEAIETLDRIAAELRGRFGGTLVRVEGHTDTDPISQSGFADNEELSMHRALVVERHLVGRGVPSDRIYAAAFGPDRPRATLADSRRVEIVVLRPAAE